MSIKKIFLASIFLSIFILSFLDNVPTAKAASIEELLAKIAEIQTQILQLQTQLAQLSSLKITTPNKGEIWELGKSYEIRWISAGRDIISDVTLYLYKGGTLHQTIAATSNIGVYIWGIPIDLEAGNDYKIRVVNSSHVSFYDDSDINFEIKSPSLTVVSPNGGEKIEVEKTFQIKWNYDSSLVNNYLQLELWRGDLKYRLINSNISVGAGSYDWKLPVLPIGNDYKIKIFTLYEPIANDFSDANFEIVWTPSVLKNIENQLASISAALSNLLELLKKIK